MAKPATYRRLVFIGLTTGLVISCLFAYLGHPAIARRWKLHLVMADADASAETWIDINGNGYRDSNEPPMKGVCVWHELTLHVPDDSEVDQICGDPFHQTGESGEWPNPEESYLTFQAGAYCSDIYIYARSPQGFGATSPIIVNGCHAKFGFARESSVSPRFSYDSYIERTKRRELRQGTAFILGVFVVVVVCAFVVSIKVVCARKQVK